jgi:hypothetical protein
MNDYNDHNITKDKTNIGVLRSDDDLKYCIKNSNKINYIKNSGKKKN